jgi:DNA-binding transcriptional regulator YiaG
MSPTKIRKIAEKMGSQRELARFLGVNDRTVRYWIAGNRKPGPEKREELRELALEMDKRP